MTFREQLNEDLNVLLNAEEMADVLNINSKEIICILSEDNEVGKKNNQNNYDNYGLFFENKILTMAKKEWDKIDNPSYGSTIYFDNTSYKITSKIESFGLIKLKLEGNRT